MCRRIDVCEYINSSVNTELTDRTGFDSALNTVNQAILYQAHDPDSLKSLYQRLYSDVPLFPPLENSETLPNLKKIPERNDFEILDGALKRGGAVNG